MNPNWDIVSREGWEDIANIKVKGKTFTVTFKRSGRSTAGTASGRQVLPAHKVAGQDFNKLWSDSIDIASGAFKFGSWQKGTQLTPEEPAYDAVPRRSSTGSSSATSAGASQFQALKPGEGDVVEPQPQVQIVDIYKDSKFKVQAGPGYRGSTSTSSRVRRLTRR